MVKSLDREWWGSKEMNLTRVFHAAPSLGRDREWLRDSDLELAAIQDAVDTGRADATLSLAAWLAKLPRWSQPLERDEHSPCSMPNDCQDPGKN